MANKLWSKFSVVSVVALSVFVASCSSSSSSAPVDLSPEAAAGREISITAGCASCHGENGEGRVGPKWVGLADSQVTLSDGTVVTADDAYLYESTKYPGEKKRRGASGIMPANKLTDAEIASIIAYIRALK
jgi:cytochrome c oxidase subunit 2